MAKYKYISFLNVSGIYVLDHIQSLILSLSVVFEPESCIRPWELYLALGVVFHFLARMSKGGGWGLHPPYCLKK